jgi:hypothetical protein
MFLQLSQIRSDRNRLLLPIGVHLGQMLPMLTQSPEALFSYQIPETPTPKPGLFLVLPLLQPISP